MRLFYLIFLSYIFCFDSWTSTGPLDDGIMASMHGCPLEVSFFHRRKAKSPVFLECTGTDICSDQSVSRQFTIRKWSGDGPQRECPQHAQDRLQACPMVGILFISLTSKVLHIETIDIIEQYQRQGYGTQALLTLLNLYNSRKSLSFTTFTLSVIQSQRTEDLLKFYRNFGFVYPQSQSIPKENELIPLEMERSNFNPAQVVIEKICHNFQ